MKGAKIAAFCLLAIILSAGITRAGESGRRTKLLLQNGFSARSTPAGFGDNISLALMRYYSDSDSIVFRNNHIGAGISDDISPASNEIGAYLEFEPIAVFNLRVQYNYVNYFGMFSAIVLFPTRDANYSSGIMNHIDNDNIIAATGTHLKIMPTLQAEFKRVIMTNMSSFEWFDINENGYFYEPTNDMLMKTKEYFFSNMTILGYQIRGSGDNDRMIIGTRYSYLRAESSSKQRQQLDGAFIWMMGDKRWFMEKPRLVFVAGGFLEDRYRERDFFVGTMFNFEYTLKNF